MGDTGDLLAIPNPVLSDRQTEQTPIDFHFIFRYRMSFMTEEKMNQIRNTYLGSEGPYKVI